MITRRRIIALLCLSLIWPFAQLMIFLITFEGAFDPDIAGSLVFLPAGVLTAACLLWMRAKAVTSLERRCIVIGYVISFPIALFSSLMGGLALDPVIGATIYGVVPVVMGIWIGRGIGKRLS